MSAEPVRAELAKVLEVLLEDADLRAWYEHLAGLTVAQRSAEFASVAMRMKQGGEHPDLVTATALLASPEVESAFRLAFEEALRG